MLVQPSSIGAIEFGLAWAGGRSFALWRAVVSDLTRARARRFRSLHPRSLSLTDS